MIFLTGTKCKIRFITLRINCKVKKWVQKCLEILSIKGGVGGVGGPTPNGKIHLKFPFLLIEHLPYSMFIFSNFPVIPVFSVLNEFCQKKGYLGNASLKRSSSRLCL